MEIFLFLLWFYNVQWMPHTVLAEKTWEIVTQKTLKFILMYCSMNGTALCISIYLPQMHDLWITLSKAPSIYLYYSECWRKPEGGFFLYFMTLLKNWMYTKYRKAWKIHIITAKSWYKIQILEYLCSGYFTFSLENNFWLSFTAWQKHQSHLWNPKL